MALFSLVLSAAGSAPTGVLGVDRLSVTVACLTSLAVYLVPLLALLMSLRRHRRRGRARHLASAADLSGVAGRSSGSASFSRISRSSHWPWRWATALLPGPRWSWTRARSRACRALWRLFWSSLLLGATFLGVGLCDLVAWSGRPSGAAGLAIGLWLVLIVLYDLGLLAAVVADNGGWLHDRGLSLAAAGQPRRRLPPVQPGRQPRPLRPRQALAGPPTPFPLWQSLTSILLWPLAGPGACRCRLPKGDPMKRALALRPACAGRLPGGRGPVHRPGAADAGDGRPFLPDEPSGTPRPQGAGPSGRPARHAALLQPGPRCRGLPAPAGTRRPDRWRSTSATWGPGAHLGRAGAGKLDRRQNRALCRGGRASRAAWARRNWCHSPPPGLPPPLPRQTGAVVRSLAEIADAEVLTPVDLEGEASAADDADYLDRLRKLTPKAGG